MKKINLIIILLISCINLFGQNKIDRNGNKKGKWYIYYTLNEMKYFDPLNEIENIRESLTEIEQTKAESLDEYYYEKCTYEEGLKNGMFEIYKCNKKPQLKTEILVRGNYYNGKLNGKMATHNFVIDYANDKISNQIIDTILRSSRREYIGKVSYRNNKIDKIYYAYDTPYLFSKENNNTYKRIYITKDKRIMINETDSTFKKLKNEYKYIYYHLENNKMGNKSIADINKQMSTLNTEKIIDSANYYISEITSYDTEKKLNGIKQTFYNNGKLRESYTFTNGNFDGINQTFYNDGKLRESYTFTNGHLDGPAEIYVSKNDNYVYNFPKEISNGFEYYQDVPSYFDVKTNPENVLEVIHHKETSYLIPFVVLLKSIKEHKTEYTPEDINDYFKMSDLYFTYDSVKKLSYVNDYTIYYNNKPILQRIIKDGDKGFKIFDKDGTVLMDNNKLENENIQAVQKANERLNQVLESDKSCFWCSKKVKVKDGVLLEICRCYNEKTKQNESFSTSPKFFCTNKCMYDAEKQCCSDNELIKR